MTKVKTKTFIVICVLSLIIGILNTFLANMLGCKSYETLYLVNFISFWAYLFLMLYTIGTERSQDSRRDSRRDFSEWSATERHGSRFYENTVYLSGAITGYNRETYMSKFHDAENRFRKKGYAVINPAAVCDELPEMTHHEYMEVALLLLSMSDYIFVIDGAETSKGVKAEIKRAKELNIERIYEP